MTDWRRLRESQDLSDLFASQAWKDRKDNALRRLLAPDQRDPHDIAEARAVVNLLGWIEKLPERQLDTEREAQREREVQEAMQTREGALAVARARRHGVRIPSGPMDLRVATGIGLVPDEDEGRNWRM